MEGCGFCDALLPFPFVSCFLFSWRGRAGMLALCDENQFCYEVTKTATQKENWNNGERLEFQFPKTERCAKSYQVSPCSQRDGLSGNTSIFS